MSERKSLLGLFPDRSRLKAHFPIAAAMRRAWSKGYGKAELRADALSGLVVGIVALPLSMALAIAVGVPPQHGLYTAIVAGVVVALTGGSKFQITGPTAAFVVILAPIVSKHGLSGLLTAGLLAGFLLVGMGVARFGKLIQFIPHPVTTGFTAGIATVIATLQIKDAFALRIPHMPETYLEKVRAMWNARASASLADVGVAVLSLALLIFLPRVLPTITRRVPAPLITLVVLSLVVVGVHYFLPNFAPATIGSRFHSVIDGKLVHGIPALPPLPMLPWGTGALPLSAISELGSAAFAIAMLGAIESLLSAVIADGMTGTRHDPDAELIGLGLGNIITPFFGGIAATGALARTATNVRSGARSPISAVVHALVVLSAVLLLAPLVAYVPMASLAALLLLVAWNMSEVKHAFYVMRVAPRSDVTVLVLCFLLTVFFDMVVAVSVGVVLAALLFMRRTAELTQARILHAMDDGRESQFELAPGVVLFEIAGPLFFGAAQNAMATLDAVGEKTRVVLLALGSVPSIDATGLVALESALRRLKASHKHVVLSGPLPQPRQVFERADLPRHYDNVRFAPDLASGIALASQIAEELAGAGAPARQDV
ncbi:MAG TPA: C4-dicarboxylic acid transporter DauA [Polyangiaceae bacterium]|nr:C4-dicarboxylic acid transporter DauA [Polyangiaceae bacterium]